MSEATESRVELDGQYRELRDAAAAAEREAALFEVSGADAAEYLESQLTNAVQDLEPGDGRYAALLDRKGHMRTDMRVLRLAADTLWVICEPLAASNLERHLTMYAVGREVAISERSGELALSSVIGPAAARFLDAPPSGPEHSHREGRVGAVSCRLVTTDLGIDLICLDGERDALRAALREARIPPASAESAEILRVESGRPRFGREMTEATIPQEAGINDRAVSFTKGCYIGQETVARLHYKGKPNRHLRGLRLDAPAASGDPVVVGEREVGTIGTAVISPAHGPIALAILRREAAPGDRVEVAGDNAAEVVDLPFTAP